ncbi:hypothetical protein V8B97DRAFT_1478040 [Scleroderma yunnanense]
MRKCLALQRPLVLKFVGCRLGILPGTSALLVINIVGLKGQSPVEARDLVSEDSAESKTPSIPSYHGHSSSVTCRSLNNSGCDLELAFGLYRHWILGTCTPYFPLENDSTVPKFGNAPLQPRRVFCILLSHM